MSSLVSGDYWRAAPRSSRAATCGSPIRTAPCRDGAVARVARRCRIGPGWFDKQANARGRYSRGSTETLLNEDLAILFRSGDVAALIEPVKRQFGRLHVEAGDRAGRGVNSPLFSLA